MPQPHPHTAGPPKSLVSGLFPLSPRDPQGFSSQGPLCLLQTYESFRAWGLWELILSALTMLHDLISISTQRDKWEWLIGTPLFLLSSATLGRRPRLLPVGTSISLHQILLLPEMITALTLG